MYKSLITIAIKIKLSMLSRVKRLIDIFYVNRQSVKINMKTKLHDDSAIRLIQKAKKDLEQSKNYFANVTDPDLVDYAAHKILANQSFYAYLLKKAKAENITFHV
ncbi:DUF2508 family protein [Alkalibaculum sp. M08DMB]|uniref:DUF2508 family protein n=1 Tax=Alkalibaculum sporogenes TaxID=2655001 RepID=A0A6A7K9U4_9FIRM|nr:DUF2508 family protein [Alkalibaculum sporogenes]MPW26204.1 DUF2508 family protein [Alkalibaculum sporogenes]